MSIYDLNTSKTGLNAYCMMQFSFGREEIFPFSKIGRRELWMLEKDRKPCINFTGKSLGV